MIPLLTGLILAIASVWLPKTAVDPAARALIPAIALLATGIFPCMSLAVGAMKGEQRSPKQVDELYEQLRIILQVLVTAFSLAVLTIVFIVAAIMLLNTPLAFRGIGAFRLPLAVSGLLVALLVGRIVAIGQAFFIVLDINRRHSLLTARSRIQGSRDKAVEVFRQERFGSDDPTSIEMERA